MPAIVIGLVLLIAFAVGGGPIYQPVASEATNEGGRVLVEGGSAQPVTQTTSGTQTPTPTGPIISGVSITAPIQASSEVTPVTDFRTPTISTLSAQNVTAQGATVRASVELYSHKGERVSVLYGYDEKQVTAIAKSYKGYETLPTFMNDKVRAQSVDTYIQPSESYSYNLWSLANDVTYYYVFCVDYDTGHQCSTVKSFTTVDSNFRSNTFYAPSVYINQVTDIEAYSALIKGSYRMNDGDDGIVFLVYGENSTLVNGVSKERSYNSVDESDEDLQKVRLEARVLGSGEFEYTVKNLERNTLYHYRVCIEYDTDDEAGLTCSPVYNFTTDRRDMSDKPTVNADAVFATGVTARLKGTVDMNDFNEGHVFFVYGINKNYIDQVSDRPSFSNIYQYGDDIQAVSARTDVQGTNKSFAVSVSDLKPTSIYYYRLCVEYEDENYYGWKELELTCSDTRLFVTNI